ncbi:MAG: DUF839 domain-containing protein [Pseudonocardiales bacterium]|nr:DUF839 domain-containing protein [Pseudonocardiales bacterium]
MSNGLSRRDFLQRSAAAGAGVLLIGTTEMLLTTPTAAAAPQQVGYGALIPDPNKRLALPEGFKYTIVTQAGVTKLDTGQPTPRNHDGTGAFRSRGGGTVLVNNHEIRDPFGTELSVPHLDGLTYDAGAAGGCTVIEADRDGGRRSEYVGIAGTATNCAGGVTPWNTWLTCEEIDALAGVDGFQKDHGYVFEVDPFDRGANKDPKPIKALGRFEHEAVVVDPHRGDLYLTEDAASPNGLLYRWKAPKGFRTRTGCLQRLGPTEGVLAAMKATDGAGVYVDDLSRATKVGTTYKIEWVPVPDRDGRTTATRKQFAAAGDVTRARKLEGAWWGGQGAFIVCSFARAESPVVHDGQVWFYDPRRSTLTLRLLLAKNPDPPADGAFDGPDNITVSPYGGVILAEDGEGIQHLVGATDSGATFPVARNDFTDATKNVEFTGPVYSPDKKILFANIQEPGYMFAITGPWRRQR